MDYTTDSSLEWSANHSAVNTNCSLITNSSEGYSLPFLVTPVVTAFHIIMAIAGIYVIGVNILVIEIYLTSSRLHTTTFLIIASMALTDITAGLFIPAAKIWVLIYETIHCHGLPYLHRNIHWVLQVFPIILSRLHLVLIAVDRYLSIVHPTFHRNYVTHRMCKMALGVIWIVCACAALMPVIGVGNIHGVNTMAYSVGISIAFHVVPDLFMIYLYVRMIRKVIRHNVVGPINHVTTNLCNKLKNQRKMIKMIGTTVAVFELCWAPLSLAFVVRQIYRNKHFIIAESLQNSHPIAYFIAFLNSGINIFIYAGIHPDFRAACKLKILQNSCLKRFINHGNGVTHK